MYREKTRLLQLKLVVSDLVAATAAFLASYWFRSSLLVDYFGEIYPLERYIGVSLVTTVATPILLGALKRYEVDGIANCKKFRRRDVWRLFEGLGLLYVLVSVLVFTLKLYYLSRALMILFVGIAFLLLAAVQVFLWPLLFRHAHREPLRALIVGTNREARGLASSLSQNRGVFLLGFVSEEPDSPAELDDHPVLGGVQDVEAILTDNVIDEILIARREWNPRELELLLSICRERGITARLTCDFIPGGSARVLLERVGDVPLLSFTAPPHDGNLLALKRIVDVVVSLILLGLTAPLLAVVALLIKLTSRGPVIYRQVRCGLNGRRFTFLKFRSMVEGADERRDEIHHLNEAKGPIFKISRDPRVTRLGRFLRRTSIDELPQLANILRGEMSLVGPRPPLPEEVARYRPWQRRRLSMKPGLTCLWQVSGRSVLSFEEWVDLDLRYIDNWSPWLDLRILGKTVPAVLLRRGAW